MKLATCRRVPPNSCKARLRQTRWKTCTLMSTCAVNQHYSLVTANCPSFYLHPNIPDRFLGAKMNIYHFSFSISLLIKRRKGRSWILSNISYKKLGEIFEEFSFETLEVFFFNISGWGVFHTSYKIENFETRLVCKKHLLHFFLPWYLVLYFSYSTFWGVKRALCKHGSCVRWKLTEKSFS